jgi:hypothetical protein
MGEEEDGRRRRYNYLVHEFKDYFTVAVSVVVALESELKVTQLVAFEQKL